MQLKKKNASLLAMVRECSVFGGTVRRELLPGREPVLSRAGQLVRGPEGSPERNH